MELTVFGYIHLKILKAISTFESIDFSIVLTEHLGQEFNNKCKKEMGKEF